MSQDNPYLTPPSQAGGMYSPQAQSTMIPSYIFLPLVEKAGWIKFLGIMFIISGGFQCLTIIGALAGVPLLMAGIYMLQSSQMIREGFPANTAQLQEGSQKLATALMLQGILAAIGLGIMALYFMVIFAFVIIGMIGAAASTQ